ncbi:MAG: hypothetical protein Q4D19_01065 [Lautropia sp.]|nr:hypothetical protein [Lautropia sp.]
MPAVFAAVGMKIRLYVMKGALAPFVVSGSSVFPGVFVSGFLPFHVGLAVHGAFFEADDREAAL